MIDVIVEQDAWNDADLEEAVIGVWIYKDGARVKKDDVICEMMIVKSQVDIIAPADGLLEIVAQTDGLVKKGDVICRIKPIEKVRVRVQAGAA